MGSVRGFILSHFGKNYLLIFLPFFSILSIVYIIRISILSNKISLNSEEIFHLFGLFLPEVFFYTIPISFIVAIISTLHSLSKESELIAIFSFGYKPLCIVKTFALPSTLTVLLMLTLSLYNIPHDMSSFEVFKTEKIKEAKFIIKPNKLGQKFGDYFLFSSHKKKNTLHDVVLFTRDKNMRLLFAADTANIENHNGIITLNLHNGTGDTFLPDRVKSISYSTISFFSHPKDTSKYSKVQWSFQGIKSHPKEMAWLTYYLFLSLSPLLVLGMTIALGITNPRHEKAHPHMFSFILILVVYMVASYLMRHGTPWILSSIVALFVLSNIVLLKKRLFQRF